MRWLTKKLWFRRLLFLVLVADIFFMLHFGFQNVSASPSYAWLWSKNVHFGLSSYGTEIGFSDDFYLDSFSWDDGGTQVTFNNLKMGSYDVPSLTIQTQSTNVTVTKMVQDRFEYSVSSAGSQNVTYESSKPRIVYIDGAEAKENQGWTYSSGIVTVTSAASSVSMIWGMYISPLPTIGLDDLWQNLLSLDLFGFITGAYTTLIGQLFYAIVAMIGAVVLYIRTQSLLYICILWTLIGSIVVVAMGIVSPVALLLLAFGLGGLIWKLFSTFR